MSKGDKRRPSMVDQKKFNESFNRIFGVTNGKLRSLETKESSSSKEAKEEKEG